jgi:hypothetical protein
MDRRIRRLEGRSHNPALGAPTQPREDVRRKLDELAERKASGDVTAQAEIEELARRVE